jgi:hypothetical protein
MNVSSLAPRPSCNDLPSVETQRQCALPPEHLAERKAMEAGEVGHRAVESFREVATHEGKKVALEKVASKLSFGPLVHSIARVATPVLLGAETTHALEKLNDIFGQQGELRGKAIGRENHDLAMAFLADQHRPGVFPKGYVNHRREQLMGPNAKLGDNRHTPHIVNQTVKQLEGALEAHQAGADKYLAYWEQNAGSGVREAQTRNVHDPASLESARKDKDFAAAYDKDPAFREGVRAGMWQAKADPKAFAAAHDSFVKLQDQSFLAQLGRAQ